MSTPNENERIWLAAIEGEVIHPPIEEIAPSRRDVVDAAELFAFFNNMLTVTRVLIVSKEDAVRMQDRARRLTASLARRFDEAYPNAYDEMENLS